MNGVVYYVSGMSYLEPLYVSVWSLRQYYTGLVCVFATSDVYCIVKEGLEDLVDTQLIADAQDTDPTRRDKPTVFQCVNKCFAASQSPFDKTVFLDCDTLIESNIDELFQPDIVLTTTYVGGKPTTLNGQSPNALRVLDKLNRIRENSCILRPLIHRTFEVDPPLVNVGVFTVSNRTTFMREWLYLSMVCAQWNIWEEMAAIAMMGDWIRKVTFFGSEWNAARKISDEWAKPKKIRHFIQHSWSQSRAWRIAKRRMLKDASIRSYNLL